MRRLRRTKIVATLGPSSSDEATIARLFEAGADVFRINMSHTSHDAMRKLHAAIRAVEKASGRPIGILADLQGPKLRVGTFASDAVMLKKGAEFVLDDDKTPGDLSSSNTNSAPFLSMTESPVNVPTRSFGPCRSARTPIGRPKSFSTPRIAACSLRIASCEV